MNRFFLILSILLFSLSSYGEGIYPNRCLPDIKEYLRMVKRWSGYDDTGVDGWIDRVRISAWLPEIKAKGQLDNELSAQRYYDGLTYPDQELNREKTLTYRFEIEWDLSEVVYSSDELRAARERLYWMEYLQELLQDALDVYLARKEAYLLYASEDRSLAPEIRRHDARLTLYSGGKIDEFIKKNCKGGAVDE